MILVTGGAGFIGSRIVHALCARGQEVLVTDDLQDGSKFRNLLGAGIADYIDKDDFAARPDAALPRLSAIVHQGACAVTTEQDGRFMLRANYAASQRMFELASRLRIPLLYASSAAVYGASSRCVEDPTCERPLNVYGYSKLLFDQWVRRRLPSPAPVVGLRYFNVYGPHEGHKGAMASVVLHMARQLRETGVVRLFGASHGVGPGEQRRDFVHVDDVVATNLHFLDGPDRSGIYNVGTGTSRSWNDLAAALLRHFGRGKLEYQEFPESLLPQYQAFTEADLSRLRAAGCGLPYRSIDEGVPQYLTELGAL